LPVSDFSHFFFIDKTGIDGMQRVGLEPLRFTLSIFKRGVRVHSFAWRTLGYVPDLYKGSSAKIDTNL